MRNRGGNTFGFLQLSHFWMPIESCFIRSNTSRFSRSAGRPFRPKPFKLKDLHRPAAPRANHQRDFLFIKGEPLQG